MLVSQLASILRIAYALDVERNQRIRRLRCEVVPGRLLIRVGRIERAEDAQGDRVREGRVVEVKGEAWRGRAVGGG